MTVKGRGVKGSIHASALEQHDQVALYVLGGMRQPEAAVFAGHLDGCASCRALVSHLRPVADDLVIAGPELEPPSRLRRRVTERIRSARSDLDRLEELRWLDSGAPGVRLSQLSVDTEGGRHTLLVRMDAGAKLPAHRHHGLEKCFVVEGDLVDGDQVLRAGDYVRYDAGTVHSPSTRNGCLLFVSSSLRDERVGA